MEHRIKEQQMMLLSERASTQWTASNQLRLHLSTLAYALMHA